MYELYAVACFIKLQLLKHGETYPPLCSKKIKCTESVTEGPCESMGINLTIKTLTKLQYKIISL